MFFYPPKQRFLLIPEGELFVHKYVESFLHQAFSGNGQGQPRKPPQPIRLKGLNITWSANQSQSKQLEGSNPYSAIR